MNASSSRGASQAVLIGSGAVLMSMVTQNLGAAVAKHLFPLVGAYGVTALRVALAAMLLLALRRPWRRPPARDLTLPLLFYGASLGVMNLLIYQAFARLPIGIAVGVEVLGPLAVVIITSHHRRDLIWLALAVLGLLMLLPLRGSRPLDAVGLTFAAGAAICWALYIVYGKKVSRDLHADAAAWGLLVAAAVCVPIGAVTSGLQLVMPSVLLVGLGVAVLSSALPYTLEMQALRRLPAHVMGMLCSAAPAIAALAGWMVLGEVLTLLQWAAILCIVAACAGSAVSAASNPASG